MENNKHEQRINNTGIDIAINNNELSDKDNDVVVNENNSVSTSNPENAKAEYVSKNVAAIKKAVRMSEVHFNGIDDAVSKAITRQREKESDFSNYLSNILTEFIYRYGTDLNGRILLIKISGGEILFYLKYPGFFNFKKNLVYAVDTFLLNGKTYSRDVFYNELLHAMAAFPEKNGIRHSGTNLIFYLK